MVDGKTTIIYQYILAGVITMVADVIATWLQVVITVVTAMVADVITTCLQFGWLMLSPWWLMLLPPTSKVCRADVIAMVVDVITTQGVCVVWQMLKLLFCFRENSKIT